MQFRLSQDVVLRAREKRGRERGEREKGRGAGCYFFYVQCIVLRMLFFGVQYTVMTGPTWPISTLGGEFLSQKREKEKVGQKK